jgi:hypothetical protein
MSIGTIFTLFIVPSLYVLLARTHQRSEGEPTREIEPPVPSEPELEPEFVHA